MPGDVSSGLRPTVVPETLKVLIALMALTLAHALP